MAKVAQLRNGQIQEIKIGFSNCESHTLPQHRLPLDLFGENVGGCPTFMSPMRVPCFPAGYLFSPSRHWSNKRSRLTFWASAEGKMSDSYFRKTSKVRYAYHQFTFVSFSGKMKLTIPFPSLGHIKIKFHKPHQRTSQMLKALISVRWN